MGFIIFIKDDIAVAKQRRKTLDNIELGVYDRYEEISETDFNSIELPSEKIDGVWCKTDKHTNIEFPIVDVILEPTAEEKLNALVGGMSYE